MAGQALTVVRDQLIARKHHANIRLIDRMFWACGHCRPSIQATLTQQFST